MHKIYNVDLVSMVNHGYLNVKGGYQARPKNHIKRVSFHS